MASLREYLSKRSTQELRGFLFQYLNGTASYDLNAIVTICEIIAQRDPTKQDPQLMLRQFITHYLPEVN